MKWIKAIDQLPPIGKLVIIKTSANVYFSKTDIGWEKDMRVRSDYEWLDESEQLPSSVPSDEEIKQSVYPGIAGLYGSDCDKAYIIGSKRMRDRLAPMIAKLEEEKQSMQGLANELLKIKQKYGDL